MNEISKVELKRLNFKAAFTMAEAMIVLGIVAVLAALSVVAVTNSKPDENVIMFRKTYATTLQTVQTLMNDKELYPNLQAVAYNNDKVKFAYDLAPIFLRYAAASSSGQLTTALTGDVNNWTNSCGYPGPTSGNTSGETNVIPTVSTGSTQNNGIEYYTGTPRTLGYDDNTGGDTNNNTGTGNNSSGDPVNQQSNPATDLDIPETVSSSGGINDGNCGSACVQALNNLDFSSMVTNVLGKGFKDTTVSAKSKQKYRYLNAHSSAKFGAAFASLVNGTDVTVESIAGEESQYNVSFRTADGVYWTISDKFANSNNSYISVDVGSSTDCYYSSSCKVPDKYRFKIENTGKVIAVLPNSNTEDAAACAFIKYNKINKASKIPANNGCGY